MGRRWLVYPYYVWMLLFTIIPLFLIVYYAFIDTSTMQFSLKHFQQASGPMYLDVLWHSVWLAALATAICLLLGYPMAFIVSRASRRYRNTLVMCLVIPMWMSFLLRTYSWMSLLERKGLINTFLGWLNLPPINILYTDYAVLLGMVYNFLPFMILPIYSVLIKMEKSYLEAAADLGADAWTSFWKVTFPLSMPGVYSGILMVFMPAVTTFVISRLLGGGQYMLIGNVIEQQFLSIGNWGFGSAVSVLMLLIILGSMAYLSRYKRDNSGGGVFY